MVLPADEDATLPLYPSEETLDEPPSHITAYYQSSAARWPARSRLRLKVSNAASPISTSIGTIPRGESVVLTGTDLCEWSTILRSSGARQVMRMLIPLMTTLRHAYMGGQLRLGLPNRYPLFG